MAGPELPKLKTWVRFPSPAPLQLLFQPFMARRKGPCRASARLARCRGPSRNSDPATPGPNPLALVSARIKAAQAKRESRRKRPCRMTAASPPQGQRVSLAPGALCDAPRLNARRARAQPPAARRRLQSPASILSPCCGQPQRQAGEFLESAPFESSLPKGMLTCP